MKTTNCKICKTKPATVPVGAPDMCGECADAAWARIFEMNADRPGTPGNDVTNVWH